MPVPPCPTQPTLTPDPARSTPLPHPPSQYLKSRLEQLESQLATEREYRKKVGMVCMCEVVWPRHVPQEMVLGWAGHV